VERWSFARPERQQRVNLRPTGSASRGCYYQVARPIADGSLRLILEKFEPEEMPVHILHREDRLPQAKVESFVTFAVPRLRQALKRSGLR
jgi:hypothetical protein